MSVGIEFNTQLTANKEQIAALANSGVARESADLMEEFSSLLDKIANRLSIQQVSGVEGAIQAPKSSPKKEVNVKTKEHTVKISKESSEKKGDEAVSTVKAKAEESVKEEAVSEEEIVETPKKKIQEAIQEESIEEEVAESQAAEVIETVPCAEVVEVVAQDVKAIPTEVVEAAEGEEEVVPEALIENTEAEVVVAEETTTDQSEELTVNTAAVEIAQNTSKEKEIKGEKQIIDYSLKNDGVENGIQSEEVIAEADEEVATLDAKDSVQNFEKVKTAVVNEDVKVDQVETTENLADTEVIEVADDTTAQLLEAIQEKLSEIQANETANADVVYEDVNNNFDIVSAYSQIWQAQYISDIKVTSANSLLDNVEVVKQQVIENSNVQAISNLNSAGSENNAQFDKNFGSAKEARFITRAQVSSMLSRVEDVLKEVSKSKDGKTISIRLDPEELGNIKVDVSLRDGRLHARLVAESSAVSEILRDKAGELQQILKNSGIDVDQVSVSVASKAETFEESLQDETTNRQGEEAPSEGYVEEDEVEAEEANADTADHWIA